MEFGDCTGLKTPVVVLWGIVIINGMAERRISRLPDGRLFRRTDEGPEVFADGEWVSAVGVTGAMVADSLPLLDSEIDALIEADILPRECS